MGTGPLRGAPADKDKVWSAIKGVPLQMEGTVIKASPTELQIAASQDDIDAKRADIVITMSGTIPAKLMPQEGSTLDFRRDACFLHPKPVCDDDGEGCVADQGRAGKTRSTSPSQIQHMSSGVRIERAAVSLPIFCSGS